MKGIFRTVGSFLAVGILSAGLAAQTANARYDNDIQTRVTQQLERTRIFATCRPRPKTAS